MSYRYYTDDFDGDTDFTYSTSTAHFPDPSTESEAPDAFPSIDEIDWYNPELYTMPLTSDEIAALNSDIAATNSHSTPSPVANSHDVHLASSLVANSHPETHSPSPERSEPLRQADSSSWAARNPTRPTIRPRTPPPRLTDAQKASRKIQRDQKIERMTHLHDAIAGYLDEQKMKIEALSRAHSVTPKQINDIIGSQTHYRASHKSQLINALVHAKAKEVNAGKSTECS